MEDSRRPFEGPNGFIHARRLNYTAVEGDISVEDRESALCRVGVGDGSDAAVRGVIIRRFEILGLRERFRCAYAAGRGMREALSFGGSCLAPNVVHIYSFAERRRMNRMNITVDESATIKLAEDREDAAGLVHIFDMIFFCCRGDFADARHFSRETVHVRHGVVYARFVGDP